MGMNIHGVYIETDYDEYRSVSPYVLEKFYGVSVHRGMRLFSTTNDTL